MIKPILFPELAVNESYGVGQKAIGKGQILYEMEKVLQNYRAEKENHPKRSVTWHKPLHYSKEPLIEVTSIQKEIKQAKRNTVVKAKNRVKKNGKRILK